MGGRASEPDAISTQLLKVAPPQTLPQLQQLLARLMA